ncbi:BQ2448_2456 [Microbotryum intermedium]|uniref:BQ2448_2456 protein n=1 Tax=Microbotryum intermedium TaxID=269621 RepID=A0A238FEB3_9BASI|nr:BQ2448_2456 [Microbotryum intermedium]
MAIISPFYHPYIMDDMIVPPSSSPRPRAATEYDLFVSPAMLSSAVPPEVPRPSRSDINSRAFQTTKPPLQVDTATTLSSRTKNRANLSSSPSIIGPIAHEVPLSLLACSNMSTSSGSARELTMSRRSSSSTTTTTGMMSPPHSPGAPSPFLRAVTEAEMLAARVLTYRKPYTSNPASPTSLVSVAPILAPKSPSGFSSASTPPSPPPGASPTMKYKKPNAELDRWLQALSLAQSRADARLPETSHQVDRTTK